jgi:hypothetical protein
MHDTPTPMPKSYLCVAPGAFLYQAPRHRTTHREALKDTADEVTEAEGHQLLVGECGCEQETCQRCLITVSLCLGHAPPTRIFTQKPPKI